MATKAAAPLAVHFKAAAPLAVHFKLIFLAVFFLTVALPVDLLPR